MAKRRKHKVMKHKRASRAKYATVRHQKENVGAYTRYEPVHHDGYARPKKAKRKMRRVA